ncbi:hypothetical protein AGMMS50212_06070 [Spirochaetia bacterium]|nr:hypothetical protein AGMMS50212_06070 [Spirochaetia bacterium]
MNGHTDTVLFTFETISAALNCELVIKGLKKLGAEQTIIGGCRVIPVPRKLEASCTYAIVAETGDITGLCTSLGAKGANYKKVFRFVGEQDFEEL